MNAKEIGTIVTATGNFTCQWSDAIVNRVNLSTCNFSALARFTGQLSQSVHRAQLSSRGAPKEVPPLRPRADRPDKSAHAATSLNSLITVWPTKTLAFHQHVANDPCEGGVDHSIPSGSSPLAISSRALRSQVKFFRNRHCE